MKLRTRRLFFYALVAVFLVVGGYLVLSASGLVLDWKTLRVEKTGALFLKFSPPDARIYLDGKLQPSSAGLFSRGVFLPNLVPGDYSVRLTAEGYADWNKDLSVEPGLVTAASAVQLWPDNWAVRPVPTGTVISPGAIDGQTYAALFNELRRTQLDLSGTVPIEQVFPHPFSGSRVIIASQKAVYLLDLRQKKLSLVLRTPGILAAAVSENEVFAFDASSTLDVFNLLLQAKSAVPLGLPNAVKLAVTPEGGNIFILEKDGTLAEYSRATQATTTLTEGAADLWLSPGEERAAVQTQSGGLEIVALSDFWSDQKFTAGETWSAPVPGGRLDDFAWLPNLPNYGLALADGRLAVVGLDDREPEETSVIADGVSKFYVNGSEVFFLSGKTWKLADLGNL